MLNLGNKKNPHCYKREKEDFSLTLQSSYESFCLFLILTFTIFSLKLTLWELSLLTTVITEQCPWYIAHTAAHSCQPMKLTIGLRISQTPFSHRAVSQGLSEWVIRVFGSLLLLFLTLKVLPTPFLT